MYTHLLYKIYSENGLIYIGRTKYPLENKLREHFFKTPSTKAINIECITKIEYSVFHTEADALLYEDYYINLLKPPLNHDRKSKEPLSISLPETMWYPFESKRIDEWKDEISENNLQDKNRELLQKTLVKERKHKKREIFLRTDISQKEKYELWNQWLIDYYEPIRNEIL